ncbi:unnamed protein product [Moneuplotes crassus]|uniref:Uncharacterized protein n=1 Tax=Euplotes crassus TaxID=5936 RepID=A0AAD1XSH4_EUPCR|nr:unnamed protein product [Moneuplotes crassus]
MLPKNVCVLAILIVLFVAVSQASNRHESPLTFGTLKNQALTINNPYKFCTLKTSVMAFFAGTQTDPNGQSSKCVSYFPELLDEWDKIKSKLSTQLLVPTHFFNFWADITSLITRFSLWQTYCTFNTMYGALDHVFSSLEGAFTVLLKYTTYRAEVNEELRKILDNNNKEKCPEMFHSVGKAFSLLFGFNVPQDVV